MKSTQINKKLMLNKETLRVLTDHELRFAAGGFSAGCVSRNNACPDTGPTTTTDTMTTGQITTTITITDIPTRIYCPTR